MIAMASRCVVTANRQFPYRPAGIVGFGLAAIRYGCNVVERLKGLAQERDISLAHALPRRPTSGSLSRSSGNRHHPHRRLARVGPVPKRHVTDGASMQFGQIFGWRAHHRGTVESGGHSLAGWRLPSKPVVGQ